MKHRNVKEQMTWNIYDLDGMPFICHILPFVGHGNPGIKPFIRSNKPFIGIKSKLGFTIVELMITLVIAGVLAAFALPAFQNFIKDNRLKARTSEMVSHLQLARSEAAKQKMRTTICTSTNGSACTAGTAWENGWIVWSDRDGDNAINADTEILNSAGPSGQAITINAGSDTMAYLPDGTAVVPGGGVVQFTFCDDRTAEIGRQISIALTGRAESERFTCP
jgi:type IV fimbrial biogenesis protein FimT